MTGLTIQLPRASVSPANRIYVLDGLVSGDQKTATDRYEQMLNFVRSRDLSAFDSDQQLVIRLTCPNVPTMIKYLHVIRDDCLGGVKPFLVIEGHGDLDKGLQLPSGEFLGWRDYVDHLGQITLAAGGDLTVFSAFCHSHELTSRLQFDKPPPFAFHFGYEGEPSAEAVGSDGNKICESAMANGGRDLFFDDLKTSCRRYSEYDHVESKVVAALAFLTAPELARRIPGVSKRSLRRRVERSLADEGIPLSAIKDSIQRAMTSELIVQNLLWKFMYPTERRDRYWEAIRRLLQKNHPHISEF